MPSLSKMCKCSSLAFGVDIMPKRPDPPVDTDGTPFWKKQCNTPTHIWMLWMPDEQKYCEAVFPIFSTRYDALQFVDRQQEHALARYMDAPKYQLHKMRLVVIHVL